MHKKFAKVAIAQPNQWAMSFENNMENIIESIKMAKQKGASYRLGPELEVCGYTCEDAFFEPDTERHSWDVIAKIIADTELTKDILCDIGMPVQLNSVLYNCRVFILNQEVLLIRPKLHMAGGDNYREMRWFRPWTVDDGYGTVEFELPNSIKAVNGQKTTTFGNAIVKCNDTKIATEICEELWVARNPHVDYCLAGVEIISNSSGSHHELRKLNYRRNMVVQASGKHNCVYLYSNLKGGDGGRMYFDGGSLVAMNGKVMAEASQFSIDEVEVEVAVLDLSEVRNARAADTSRRTQASKPREFKHVIANIDICRNIQSYQEISQEVQSKIYSISLDPHSGSMEEIAHGPALWLWDYLRRSGARGFYIPLSGGSDSAVVASIVGSMCNIVFESIQSGNQKTLKTLQRIVKNEKFVPTKFQDIVGQIFVTCYLGTTNSSDETRDRAKRISESLGAQHFDMDIDEAYESFVKIFAKATGKTPKYQSEGGAYTEDLALQNIQARTRMVLSYLMAQLVPWAKDGNGNAGFLLVLGSSNIAEGLRGYLTKYDCSAADLNPIGGINKTDLKAFLIYFGNKQNIPVLAEVAGAVPSAELRPQKPGELQSDEQEMGMTYAELDEYGKLRLMSRNGPLSMFESLLVKWSQKKDSESGKILTAAEIATKVKFFFRMYSINRHKMCVLPPSYHAERYGNDDNRYDLRQILYDVSWKFQFEKIDELAKRVDELTAKSRQSKM